MNNMSSGDSVMQHDLFQQVDGGANPTSPLQLFIRPVNHTTATNFYARWHYLGETDFISTINFGAYFDNICLGVISYGSPNATEMKGYYDRNTQEGWWEIKRLAMDDKAPRNSESRFIAISMRLLRKMFKVVGMVTLADSSVGHVGIIYKASGFKYLGLTAPKKDFFIDGKIQQRGKTKGKTGEWRDRSRKHLFVMQLARL